MAIVKATYTKSRGVAKASVRYIQHRPGKDGQKIKRTLFGNDGVMKRNQAYHMIDIAKKGTNFFRLVLSPDPKKEDRGKDLHLRKVTEQTMLKLEERMKQKIHYVGAIHDDHTQHRHVHVIALVRGRLTPKDFQELRQSATDASLFQRRERDLAQGIKQERSKKRGWRRRSAGKIQTEIRQAPSGGGHKDVKHDEYKCPICGMENCRVHRSIIKELQWGR